MQATSSLFSSKNTSGLRNRLAKFKAPDVSVIHDSPDDIDEEDNEALMQSFLSASSGASSEESDTKAKKRMVDSGDEGNGSGRRDGDEQQGSTRSNPLRFSSQTNASSRQPMRRSTTRRSSGSIYAPREPRHSSSSWWGLDLSIIVALVSPLGNLLTGGDHIKNVLLLLFLVYYLHQLVEGLCFNLNRLLFLTD